MNLDEIKLSDNRFFTLETKSKRKRFFCLIEAENRDSEVLKSSFGLSYPLSVCLLLLYFFICKYLNISNIQNEAPYFFLYCLIYSLKTSCTFAVMKIK